MKYLNNAEHELEAWKRDIENWEPKGPLPWFGHIVIIVVGISLTNLFARLADVEFSKGWLFFLIGLLTASLIGVLDVRRLLEDMDTTLEFSQKGHSIMGSSSMQLAAVVDRLIKQGVIDEYGEPLKQEQEKVEEQN